MARGNVIIGGKSTVTDRPMVAPLVTVWDNDSADALDALDALELGTRVLDQMEEENA